MNLSKINIEMPFLILFLIGFLCIGGLLLSNGSCVYVSWCGQDIDQYKDYSDSILAGKGFSASAVANMYYIEPKAGKLYVPEILRLPGYPVFLSAARLFLDKPIIILWSNTIFYGFTLFYTFKLFEKKQPHIVIFLLTLIMGLNPTLLFYTFVLPSVDIFSAFCLVGFVFHLQKLVSTKRPGVHFIIVTTLSVFGLFTRQNLFPVVIGTYLYWLVLSKTATHKKFLLVSLLVSIMALFSWSYRNYRLTGGYVLSSLSGMQLFSEHVYFTPYPNTDSMRLYKMEIESGGFRKKMDDNLKTGLSVAESYAKLDDHMQNITFKHIMSNPSKLLLELPRAYQSFMTLSSFGRSEITIIAYLQTLFSFLNNFILYLFPLSLLFVIFLKLSGRLIFMGTILSLFIFISVFYHGTVVANRGIIPVWPLLVTYLYSVWVEYFGGINLKKRQTFRIPSFPNCSNNLQKQN